jgi:hypothetical protein
MKDFINALGKQLMNYIYPNHLTSQMHNLQLSNRKIRKKALQTILDGDLPVRVPCGDSVRTVIIHRSGAVTIDDHSEDELKTILVGEVLGQPPCSCLKLREIFRKTRFDSLEIARLRSDTLVRSPVDVKPLKELVSKVKQVPGRQVKQRLINLFRFIHALRIMRCTQKRVLDNPDYAQRVNDNQMWDSLERKIYNLITETRSFNYGPYVNLKFKTRGIRFRNPYYDQNYWKSTTVVFRGTRSRSEIDIKLGADFIKLYNRKQWYCVDTSGFVMRRGRSLFQPICPTHHENPIEVKYLILAENPVKVQVGGRVLRDCLVFVPRHNTVDQKSFFKRVYVDENNRVAAFVQPYPKDAFSSRAWSWTPAKRVSWVE